MPATAALPGLQQPTSLSGTDGHPPPSCRPSSWRRLRPCWPAVPTRLPIRRWSRLPHQMCSACRRSRRNGTQVPLPTLRLATGSRNPPRPMRSAIAAGAPARRRSAAERGRGSPDARDPCTPEAAPARPQKGPARPRGVQPRPNPPRPGGRKPVGPRHEMLATATIRGPQPFVQQHRPGPDAKQIRRPAPPPLRRSRRLHHAGAPSSDTSQTVSPTATQISPRRRGQDRSAGSDMSHADRSQADPTGRGHLGKDRCRSVDPCRMPAHAHRVPRLRPATPWYLRPPSLIEARGRPSATRWASRSRARSSWVKRRCASASTRSSWAASKSRSPSDDKGSLQATVRTESAQGDGPAPPGTHRDLARTLDQAGVRTDAQSFLLENPRWRQHGQQAQQQHAQIAASSPRPMTMRPPPEPIYRPVRSDGQVDLLRLRNVKLTTVNSFHGGPRPRPDSANTPTINADFTMFLKLLTAQMQNQDPLDPDGHRAIHPAARPIFAGRAVDAADLDAQVDPVEPRHAEPDPGLDDDRSYGRDQFEHRRLHRRQARAVDVVGPARGWHDDRDDHRLKGKTVDTRTVEGGAAAGTCRGTAPPAPARSSAPATTR